MTRDHTILDEPMMIKPCPHLQITVGPGNYGIDAPVFCPMCPPPGVHRINWPPWK